MVTPSLPPPPNAEDGPQPVLVQARRSSFSLFRGLIYALLIELFVGISGWALFLFFHRFMGPLMKLLNLPGAAVL